MTVMLGGASGYRNHSEHIEGDLACLEVALFITVAPCAAAFVAMLYGDVALMVACFLAAIGTSLLWFVAYFVLFA